MMVFLGSVIYLFDLGSFQQGVNNLLDGQPLQLMAEHGENVLWAFAI
jgi:hypothetical protein